MIAFSCPRCQGAIAATEKQRGQRMQCPRCGGVVVAPPRRRRRGTDWIALLWALVAFAALAAFASGIHAMSESHTVAQALQKTQLFGFSCLTTAVLYVIARALDRIISGRPE